jgi:regulator of sigma E protease
MITTILIFIVILGILVFVHEFGHFIVAKKSGMQVEEFGFGFPPRIAGIQKVEGKFRWVWGHKMPDDRSQTVYSINWIPLGGFVRIVGENNEDEHNPASFINKGFWPRFFTLVAGVTMNVILAWVLLSITYGIGAPAAVLSPDDVPKSGIFTDAKLGIAEVVPDLAADKAGIQPGDKIVSIDEQKFNSLDEIQNYIRSNTDHPLKFELERGKQNLTLTVTPNPNPAPNTGPTGISLGFIGNLRYPWHLAPVEGAKTTWHVIGMITDGLYKMVTGKASLDDVGGPVKIAKYVGMAKQTGFTSLVNLTIILSLSLAVLNILPFPALDGGRVLFLIIEKIRGKRNNQKFEQIANTAGFVFLLLLMLLVTVNDIFGK